MTVNLSRDGNTVGDALVILDGATKVDTTHGLNIYLKFLELLDGRQLQAVLIANAIYLANILIVDEHLGIVVSFVQCEHAWCADFRQKGDVDHRTPAMIEFLHRAQRTVHHHAVYSHQQVGMLCKLEWWDGNKRCWHLGDGRQLGLAVLLHHLAQLEELIGSATILIYRGIIIIAGNIRCKAR